MTVKSARGSVVAAVVVTVVGGIASADMGTAARTRSAVWPVLPLPAQKQKLVDHALKVAALHGESNPTNGLLVATTRRAFNDIFGAGTDVDANVYVLVLRGQFVANLAPRPYGAPAPAGQVLSLAYEAVTNDLTDWSLGATLAAVGQLGPSEPIG